ncbi:MAG: WecB/TagA/CpsF family glycosyltransferase [Gammaproteobacteria bacterium]|uniref:WecB/TagA/CpsF family glycosyltransferase n=1 Tax=Methylotuvimicrobium sp. TaxID=2822413 RepID=UPI001D929AF7|nr:WecB/TagA/CpsF family glycosyltransferase [Gammaproteobacteria bacterium]
MHKRLKMFGIDFDALTMPEAVAKVLLWSEEPDYRCRYLVTPNVDHVVKFQTDQALRAAYRDAAMVTVDGKPVLWASRLLGKSLPGLVAGSDFCPALFDAAKTKPGLRVFLLGAAEGVAVRAAETISRRWPWVTVVGCYSPPMGFNAQSAENRQVLDMINQAKPDVLLIGLGAPKQEIWVHAMQDQLQVKAALCIGATIDFLAGEKMRAPKFLRTLGLEWLHRMLSEPKRLAGRYWHDAKVFPRLVLREFINKTPT